MQSASRSIRVAGGEGVYIPLQFICNRATVRPTSGRGAFNRKLELIYRVVSGATFQFARLAGC
jgi:hypothetical protein